MSINITYQSTETQAFGFRNGTVNLKQPINLDPNTKKRYRIVRVILSNELPNIYNFGGFNNTGFRISRDGGLSWTTCTLQFGIYSISQLNLAINNCAQQESFWKDNNDPGYELNYNPTTKIVYIKLDSTKLTDNPANQLGIDFSGTRIYETLGFVTTKSYITDGLKTASDQPQMDAQGTYVDVFCSIIQGSRYVNENLSNIICRVPIVDSSNVEIVFPSSVTGLISPIVRASIPSIIQSYDIRFINGRGRDCVFLTGSAQVEIEIFDE